MVHVDKPTQLSNMEKELVAQHPVVVHAYIQEHIAAYNNRFRGHAHAERMVNVVKVASNLSSTMIQIYTTPPPE